MKTLTGYSSTELLDGMRMAIENKRPLNHEQIKGIILTMMVVKFTHSPIEMVFKGHKGLVKYIMDRIEEIDTVKGADMFVENLNACKFTVKQLVFWISVSVKRYAEDLYNQEGVREEVTISGLLKECENDLDGNFVIGLNLMAIKDLAIKAGLGIFCACSIYWIIHMMIGIWIR